MKQRHFLSICMLILCLGLFTSCSNMQPVQSFNNQPIPSGLSNTEIENAIRTAGVANHWTIKVENPNLIRGDLYWKKYYVHVDIPHDKNSYSIIYKDSKNLKYKNGEIRSGYNKWAGILNHGIQQQLNLAKNQQQKK